MLWWPHVRLGVKVLKDKVKQNLEGACLVSSITMINFQKKGWGRKKIVILSHLLSMSHISWVVGRDRLCRRPHGPMTPSGAVVQAARQALGWIGESTITTSNVYICFCWYLEHSASQWKSKEIRLWPLHIPSRPNDVHFYTVISCIEQPQETVTQSSKRKKAGMGAP